MVQVSQPMAPNDNAATPYPLKGYTVSSDAKNQIFQDSSQSAQANVLDQYESYTYNISWYLVTPQDIQTIYQSGTLATLPPDRLIVQSGGIAGTGRNPNFNVDFYIEKLTLLSTLAGQTGTATSTENLHMTVVEPYGITFVQTLVKAINQLYGTSINNAQTGQGGQSVGNQQKQQVETNAAFNLINITFQGYDTEGNLVRGSKNGQVIQKYFIAGIQKLDYKVSAKKMVEYEITFNVDYTKAQSMGAAIPQQIELTAATVKDALVGPSAATATPANGRTNTTSPGTSQTSSPPVAGSAKNQNGSVRQSISQILNSFQAQQVQNGTYMYADQFIIELHPSIASAKVTVDGGLLKGTGTLTEAPAAQKVSSARQSVQPTVRNLGFEAGTTTSQIIDNVIRNSTYITNQSNTKISERTGQATPNQKGTNSQMNWYKISMQTTPLQWDPHRNNYAYRYRYVVTPFKVAFIQSQYFNNPDSPGIHKRYDYMFTGLNTQVIEWEIKLNNQYTTFMTNSGLGISGANSTGLSLASLASTAAARIFAPRSGQSSQGAAGKTNEIAANAADYLYDPVAMSNIELTILGDPAWILQGERWQLDAAVSANPTSPTGTGGAGQPFLADGTINVDYGHILFELVVNTPKDYDLDTGLMNPNASSAASFISAQTAPTGMSAQSYIVQTTTVQSEFSQGKFTQRLSGRCIQYNPNQTARYGAVSGLVPGTVSNLINSLF